MRWLTMLVFHLIICLNATILYRYFCCDATTYEPRRRDKRDISRILKNAKRPSRHQILNVFNVDDTNNLTKILDTHLRFETGTELNNKTAIPIVETTDKLKSSQQILEGITLSKNQESNDNTNNSKIDLSSLKEMFKTFWENKNGNYEKLSTPKNVTSKLKDINTGYTKNGIWEVNTFGDVTETSKTVIEKNETTNKNETQIKHLEVTRPPRPHKCPSPSQLRKHIF